MIMVDRVYIKFEYIQGYSHFMLSEFHELQVSNTFQNYIYSNFHSLSLWILLWSFLNVKPKSSRWQVDVCYGMLESHEVFWVIIVGVLPCGLPVLWCNSDEGHMGQEHQVLDSWSVHIVGMYGTEIVWNCHVGWGGVAMLAKILNETGAGAETFLPCFLFCRSYLFPWERVVSVMVDNSGERRDRMQSSQQKLCGTWLICTSWM